MGFIGKVFKGIAKGVGGLAKGVMKFAKSPFGKLLLNVGLSFVTGGAGGLLTKGLGMLGKMGGIGKMVGSFGGFASKFLGPVQSFMSKSGLGGLSGFLQNSGSSGDLLKMATDIFASRKKQPATDPATNQIVQNNLSQMFAQRQAQMMQW
jgi:hypothetical protein